MDKVRLIEKQNTTTRGAVSAEVDAFSSAKILAIGKSYEDLKFSTAISLLLSKFPDDSQTFLNPRNKLGAFSKIPQGFLSKGNLFPTELYSRSRFMHRYELVLIPIRIYVYRKLYRGTWVSMHRNTFQRVELPLHRVSYSLENVRYSSNTLESILYRFS